MFAQETQPSFLKSHISREDFSHWFVLRDVRKMYLGYFFMGWKC